MLSHEYFHEQAHIEKRHEIKRILFLFILSFAAFLIYRFFCHRQEYEADYLAAKKCGKNAAIESLKFLQMRERSGRGEKFFAPTDFFSLHPKTQKRINAISQN
jgi:Zn-dependent protease with chaperone function